MWSPIHSATTGAEDGHCTGADRPDGGRCHGVGGAGARLNAFLGTHQVGLLLGVAVIPGSVASTRCTWFDLTASARTAMAYCLASWWMWSSIHCLRSSKSWPVSLSTRTGKRGARSATCSGSRRAWRDRGGGSVDHPWPPASPSDGGGRVREVRCRLPERCKAWMSCDRHPQARVVRSSCPIRFSLDQTEGAAQCVGFCVSC